MSRHTEFYGGSPGPPLNSAARQARQNGLLTPSNHAYGGAGRRFGVHSQPMNGADQFYAHGAGINAMHDFGYTANHPAAYQYSSPMQAFYYGTPTLYYSPPGSQSVPPQFVDSGNQYTEWSSPDFPTPSSVSPPQAPGIETNSPTPETRSSSNDSGGGKSRRFSRQRNFKDGDGLKSHSSSNKPQYKSVPKHEIRFSHQKREMEKKTESEPPQPSANPEIEPIKAVDQRFSLIRSIGKREVDTGYVKPKSVESGTAESPKERKPKMIKKKTEKPLSYQSSENQLSVLLDQLTLGTYECMVCCDRVKQQHAIWNCGKCYHVFHMGCIKKWARSATAHVEGQGWRCPSCQNVNKKVPNTYRCYCGKVNEPEWNRRETPHSCGEMCGKKRSNNATCTHPCNILCHPGPCPPCPASVIKPCLCGNMTRKVRCSQQKPLMCTDECGKVRNCGIHKCEVVCHSGECNDCDILMEQACFCNKTKRNVVCGSTEVESACGYESNAAYSCGKKCEKNLSCGNHKCEEMCHDGECKPCELLPSNVTTCPCTQSKLSCLTDVEGQTFIRTRCTDPIPTCEKICSKPLKCGGDSIHTCQIKCHSGACPPCTDNTSTIYCRCGKSENEVPCGEIPDEPYVCDRRCNKKRKCGRHKCGKTCCTDTEHQCMQICGRKLECKLHKCEETCHRGNCHSCYNVSFDELSCACGAEILYPPIQCGTKPPECLRTCARQHPCFHPVRHNCHNEEKCPPCVVLLKKQCNCGKVMRNNIPCHQANVSCGAQCKKVLPCGHNCLKPCHQGPCAEEGAKCTQPCSIMRVECIHPCAMPCHQGKSCPLSSCKAKVTLKCACGNREMQVACSDGGATYQRLSSEAFARQQNAKGSVDISNLFQGSEKQKVIPCDDQCTAIERNRRLAEAFDIDEQNSTDSEQQLFSPFLQMWAKQDFAFVQSIEQELTNIVDTVSWLDKSKRSHTFASMRREKRQVVHELAEAFNCKSVSVDEEPNRSVLVTAVRGMSKIPRVLLSDGAKKRPGTLGFSKPIEPKTNASNDATDSKKRLLRSMKLVSLTSASEPGLSNQPSKRPASIPRMPSHPSVLGRQSNLSGISSIMSSSDLTARHESRNTWVQTKTAPTCYHPPNSSGIVASQNNRAPSGRKLSGSKKEKDEPEIDYFDVTT